MLSASILAQVSDERWKKRGESSSSQINGVSYLRTNQVQRASKQGKKLSIYLADCVGVFAAEPFFPSRAFKCCSKASRRLLGACASPNLQSPTYPNSQTIQALTR